MSSLPRVLIVHNHYQQPGGEDQVVRAEAALLRERGHDVHLYTEDNRVLGLRPTLRTAVETVWSAETARKLGIVLRQFRPDVAHFHNTFPLISPSAYYACQLAGVRVVQTVHHYRLACPAATLYRDGHPCTDCLGKPFALPAALHGCYHHSRPTSAVIATMNAAHHLNRTWQTQVDRYIALSHFQRLVLLKAGLPEARVSVKGNFLHPDPGIGEHRGDYMLFVGRLIPEKGVLTLLHAWQMPNGGIPLKIVGDGPLANDDTLASAVQAPNIEWLGRRSPAEVTALMGDAAAVIVPSEWPEPFGLVAIEAFARGTPVIAARSGALSELVENNHNGLLFPAGEPEALMNRVRWATSEPAGLLAEMGRNARRTFVSNFTAEQNYAELMGIYSSVL